MKSINTCYTSKEDLKNFIKEHQIDDSASLLVQVFISEVDDSFLKELLSLINKLLPQCVLIGSSADGCIYNGELLDIGTVISFTKFEKTVLKSGIVYNKQDICSPSDLIRKIVNDNTKLTIAFACGERLNGELFLKTIDDINAKTVVAGGVAGIKDSTKKPYVFTKAGIIDDGVVGVSFSSDKLSIHTDYGFNWQNIGKKLIITKAMDNRVYTIDGENAVDIFKYYLGETAVENIEKIGVEFPLIVKRNGLNIARAAMSKKSDGSLIFAGNLKEGDEVQFGFGNVKDILNKTTQILKSTKEHPSEAIFVYSCVGRKSLMHSDIEQETLPLQGIASTCGFFTHGEFYTSSKKEFLNLTVTLLSLSENQELKEVDLELKDSKKDVDFSMKILTHLLDVADIELQKQTRELQKQKHIYETLFEKSPDGMMVIKDGKIIHCNENLVKLFACDSKEDLIGTSPAKFSPSRQPDGKSSIKKVKETLEYVNKHGKYQLEWLNLTKDGRTFWSEITLIPSVLDNSNVVHIVCRDISQRKHIQAKLQENNTNLKSYLQAIDDSEVGLFVVSEDFKVQYMNSTMKNWFGDQVNKICYRDVAGADEPCPYCQIKNVIDLGKTVHYKPTTPDGQTFEIVATSILNADGTKSKMEVIRNVTKQEQMQNELLVQKHSLDYQANHDFLTGLPNRNYLNDILSNEIKEAKKKNQEIAFFVIDLDRFKKINDSLGHQIGDRVLQKVSKFIQNVLPNESILTRLGGDEFALVLRDFENKNELKKIAQDILDVIDNPMKIEEQTIYISSSIGISIYPKNSLDAQSLLKDADSAMYIAKNEGRNNYQFSSDAMSKQALEFFEMERNLREAIKNEEFIVYYQPQVDAKNKKLVGMEALVRWDKPEEGLIPPFKFIPIAEETGLIIALDQWVMKEAMKQFVSWYKQGLNPGKLALNLAIKQLQQENFIEMLSSMLQETEFKAEWLELEITEGQMMSNPNEAIKVFKNITDMGIELAVDDFGTGYSSLSYLKKFPINKLKIDQSFVRFLHQDRDDASIVKTIIALSKGLNLKVIAEGVENQEQRKFLIKHGCEHIQGYFYAKPMPAKEMQESILTNSDAFK